MQAVSQRSTFMLQGLKRSSVCRWCHGLSASVILCVLRSEFNDAPEARDEVRSIPEKDLFLLLSIGTKMMFIEALQHLDGGIS